MGPQMSKQENELEEASDMNKNFEAKMEVAEQVKEGEKEELKEMNTFTYGVTCREKDKDTNRCGVACREIDTDTNRCGMACRAIDTDTNRCGVTCRAIDTDTNRCGVIDREESGSSDNEVFVNDLDEEDLPLDLDEEDVLAENKTVELNSNEHNTNVDSSNKTGAMSKTSFLKKYPVFPEFLKKPPDGTGTSIANTDNANKHLEDSGVVANANTHSEDTSIVASVNTNLEDSGVIANMKTHLEDIVVVANVNTHLEDSGLLANGNTQLEDIGVVANVNTHLEDSGVVANVNTHLEDSGVVANVNTHLEDSGVVADEAFNATDCDIGLKTDVFNKSSETTKTAQNETVPKSTFLDGKSIVLTDEAHKRNGSGVKKLVQQISVLSTDGGEQDVDPVQDQIQVQQQQLQTLQKQLPRQQEQLSVQKKQQLPTYQQGLQQQLPNQQQHGRTDQQQLLMPKQELSRQPQEPFTQPQNLLMHNLKEFSDSSPSQGINQYCQGSQQISTRFHSSKSESVINQGGAGAFNVMGGIANVNSLTFPGPHSVSTAEGTPGGRNTGSATLECINVAPGATLNIQSVLGLAHLFPCQGYEGDFVIFYSESDEEKAKQFKSDLEEDLHDYNVQVQLFRYIDPNMSLNRSLETMLSRFGYIFVLITLNFKKDAEARAAGENLQADSWAYTWKRNRIVPVWTSKEKADRPFEFSSFTGLFYYRRNLNKEIYVSGLRRQLEIVRRQCMEWKKKEEEDSNK